MSHERQNETGAARGERKFSEVVRERIRLTDEEHAEVDAKLNDPNWVPRKVEWLDAGRDPFGMDWEWLSPTRSEAPPAS